MVLPATMVLFICLLSLVVLVVARQKLYTSSYLLEATSYFFVTIEDHTFQFYQILRPNVCHPKIIIYLHFGKEVIVENSQPYKVVFPLIWPPKLGENFISFCLLYCFMVRRCGGVDPPAQSDLAARQTTFDPNLSIIICSPVFLDWLVGIAG